MIFDNVLSNIDSTPDKNMTILFSLYFGLEKNNMCTYSFNLYQVLCEQVHDETFKSMEKDKKSVIFSPVQAWLKLG